MHALFAYITPLVAKYILTVIIFVHVKFFKPRKQQKHYSLKTLFVQFKANLEVITPFKSKVTHKPIRGRNR